MTTSPAFYEERIRLLKEEAGQLILTLKYAFADALIAIEEREHYDDAQRLRERWPEAAI